MRSASLALLVLALVATVLAQSEFDGFTYCPGSDGKPDAAKCGAFPTDNECSTCEDGRLGGCYADFCSLSSDGTCKWYKRPPCPEPKPDEPECDPIRCSVECKYGNKKDEKGCPTCECNDEPSCGKCPTIACDPATKIYAPPGPGECCGSCQPRPPACDACPAIFCAKPASTDLTLNYAVDDCGCQTCQYVNCSTVGACPAIKCAPGFVSFRAPDSCCPICVEPPTCPKDVECPAIDCPANFKAGVRDGDCCPSCIIIDPPGCNRADCNLKECPAGQKPVTVDGECCPVCRGDDDCEGIVCPDVTSTEKEPATRPVCLPIFQNTRLGACCKTCSVCRRTETDLIRCDADDKPVCAPGLATGDGRTCTPIVAPVVRVCREFVIRFKDQDSADILVLADITESNKDSDENKRIAKYALVQLAIKYLSAADTAKLSAALPYLTVEIAERGKNHIRIKVCWTKAESDSTVDVESLALMSENALVAGGLDSGVNFVAPVATFFALCVLFALMF